DLINSDGRPMPITLSTAVLRDESGAVIGGAETFRDISEIEELRQKLRGDIALDNLESRAASMQSVLQLIAVVAPADATVLITGETGTGKEVTARAVHQKSKRNSAPFVAVNCAALPENLLESELFGHKKGAFTGAIADKEGLFSRAGAGTLFLDEIGDVTPGLQVRLLRVLQEREFEPIGSAKTVASRARIIAATNKNLKEMVREGTFREDLYYRLNVVHIPLPALRERRADIPLLTEQFIRHFNKKYELAIPGLSPEALTMLQAYSWPGNIRELENCVERAIIVSGGKQIDLSHLPEEISGAQLTGRNGAPQNFYTNREEAEKRAIIDALQRCKTKQGAADLLGIHKTTLFKKIRKYHIQ
ncbi:MAG: AAA family ATPase, partial [bacterium]|nr:AAA family ATPase [bacterium]